VRPRRAGIKQRAALGWKRQILVYKNADPGTGLQDAIQQHPDCIAITGIPTAAMKSHLAAAKNARIPVLSCGTTDKRSPDGYAVQCGGTLERDAEYRGRWVARDSGGKANVVARLIPQFSALVTITDWLKHNFANLWRSPICTPRSTPSAKVAKCLGERCGRG
jgi:ABC-type sugar transport system substrate-binding protein